MLFQQIGIGIKQTKQHTHQLQLKNGQIYDFFSQKMTPLLSHDHSHFMMYIYLLTI